MPKVFVCVQNIQLDDDGTVRLIYRAVTHGANNDDRARDYGCDYVLDTSLSVEENNIALKQKVRDQAVARGYKLSTGDVITFGSPIVKDSASANDKTNGITSDKDAVSVDTPLARSGEVGLLAQAGDSLRRAATWLIS